MNSEYVKEEKNVMKTKIDPNIRMNNKKARNNPSSYITIGMMKLNWNAMVFPMYKGRKIVIKKIKGRMLFILEKTLTKLRRANTLKMKVMVIIEKIK